MYLYLIIPHLYEVQHVLGNIPAIIGSLKLHWQPLVFHTWKVVGCVLVGCCQAHCAWQHPTTFHIWKARGCQCGFRLLMMGGVSPKTCWASYKYGIIKFWYIVASCWIFLYELYYDARIHKHQVHNLRVSQQSQDPLWGGSLSLHRVGFNSRLVHVEFVVDQMVLGQVSLPVLGFPTNIIILMLHTTTSFTHHWHHIILVTYCVIK